MKIKRVNKRSRRDALDAFLTSLGITLVLTETYNLIGEAEIVATLEEDDGSEYAYVSHNSINSSKLESYGKTEEAVIKQLAISLSGKTILSKYASLCVRVPIFVGGPDD